MFLIFLLFFWVLTACTVFKVALNFASLYYFFPEPLELKEQATKKPIVFLIYFSAF